MEENITKYVKRAKKGDKDAFSYIVKQNADNLYRVAYGILNNYDDVSDAVSSTVLKAYENIYKLKSEQFFKTWITRILINECNMIIRNSKKLVYIDDYQELSSTDSNIETNIDVNDCIRSLDDKTREVTILYYLNDLSVKDISHILSIPEGTVKSRLATSRERIRIFFERKEELL